jgi:hypothetical protein
MWDKELDVQCAFNFVVNLNITLHKFLYDQKKKNREIVRL